MTDSSLQPAPLRPRQWIGGALVLMAIAIEAVGRLWELSRYPNPLRGIQIGLFLVGCVLFAQPSKWMLRRSDRFAERVHREDEVR